MRRMMKMRALGRVTQRLGHNDWDTFWVVLDHPALPLTNNEAERALPHRGKARRISTGTRTARAA